MAKHSIFSILMVMFLVGNMTESQAQTYLKASLSIPANAGVLAETCEGPYSLIIERGEDNQDTTLIFISDLGVAQAGVDYNFPAGSFPLEMLPSQSVATIPVNVVDDGLPEGLESLVWEIAYLAGIESGVVNVESGIVDDYEVEILSPTDTIVWCRYAPLPLTASSTAEINWSPTFLFDDPIGAEVTVRPFLSGWYYATAGSGECEVSDSVYFDLAIVEIGETDTVYICADGLGINLEGSLQGLATDFVWSPADSTLSDPTSLSPLATPSLTTTYILQSDIGVCIASDTVVVRVDSLPVDLHIAIAPQKAYYCAGEIVALFSPSYDSLDYPDITFLWTPDNNTYLSDRDLLNTALALQDTTLYIRENINNACLTTDSILINVVPPSVPLSVTDTVLCPGEMFDVVVLSDQVTEPEWSPEEGLSCVKCLNPTVTVIGTPGMTIVYEFSGKILECPVGAILPIRIPPVQQIQITGDNVVCEGDVVPLTITNTDGLSGYNWSVVFGNATLSCNDCPNPIVTINGPAPINVVMTANTSNDNFCGAQGFFQFLQGEQIQVNGPTFIACRGGEVVVSTGNPDYTDVEWFVVGGDLELSCTACPTPTVTVNSTGTLGFRAETTDPDVCRVTGTVAVSIYPGDESNLFVMPDPNVMPIGQGSVVSVALSANPEPATVMWTVNGVGIASTETTISFNAGEEVNFVEAVFINSVGCEQIDTISFVTVPPSYLIPNAFTPDNGDEVNDNFRIIINGNIVIEKFLIFNRWGQIVYEAADDDMEGWDGRFKSEPAASDTYVYTATLRYPDGRSEIAKGDVILLR